MTSPDNNEQTEDTAMAGKFEVYEDRSGTFRFRLKADNGQVIATHPREEPGFGTLADARAGVTRVQAAADGAEIVDLDHSPEL